MLNKSFEKLVKEIYVLSEKKKHRVNSLKGFLFVIFNEPTLFISDYFLSKNISCIHILKLIEELDEKILLKSYDTENDDAILCLKSIFSCCNILDLRQDLRKEHLLYFLLKRYQVCRDFFSFTDVGELFIHLEKVVKSFRGEKEAIDSLSFVDRGVKVNSGDEGVFFDENDVEDNTPVLSYFSSVTEEVKDFIHHPAIGRDKEIAKIIHVLNKKNKPNCILVGKAGVGKTAIIEGLAYNILNNIGNNGCLSGKEIYSLNICQLIAGTAYRGQAEERITKMLEYFESRNDIILFIDEIHMIIGAAGKSSNDSCDLSNILKPYLSRGKIICIGATTCGEYNKYIAPDSALERRFSLVEVKEPDVESVKTILLGIKEKYELHHGIKYGKNSIKNIINVCNEFVHDRNYPDKAIDMLDSYGAFLKLHNIPANKKSFLDFCFFYLNLNNTKKKNKTMGFCIEKDVDAKAQLIKLVS